ncbi:MAG: hypothetical protein LR015_07640 [Verrucomicrobia bacterium]|nr:hypothetical protein [Verrucomicrobiota bacterium]
MAPPKLIFLANRTQPQRLFNGLFCTALNKLGDLQILEHTGEWSDGKTLEVLQANDIVLTGWVHAKSPIHWQASRAKCATFAI